jgi:acyl homoserine lactone synthase
VKIISGTSKQLSQLLYENILAYRKKIFVDRLGWKLKTLNGMEFDQFDRPDTIYVASVDKNEQVNGCARLLPTNRPYLLGEVFPQLLVGKSAPCSPKIWELSRFAVCNLNASMSAKSYVNKHNVYNLLRKSIECAAYHGALRIITVSPVGVEKMLNRLNFLSQRAGPPMNIGGQHIFACWIDVE